VLASNWYMAGASESFRNFPQLDRLNDDVTDQALRDLRPLLPALNPKAGAVLAASPLYDPQTYAIRRLIENRIETVDDMQVIQAEIRQRLQTKRGFPGNQHIVDWMTLDLSCSFFPAGNRDNFGESWAFLEYNYLWNIGDRTALTSSGWFDPFDNGARMFTVGAFLDRPDRTNFYIGYRQIDPLESRAVTASASYVFSPKYAITAASTYDFGTSQSLSNSLILTRIGPDFQVSFGVTYNALQNNFGVVFQIFPNLVPIHRRGSAIGMLGSAPVGAR